VLTFQHRNTEAYLSARVLSGSLKMMDMKTQDMKLHGHVKLAQKRQSFEAAEYIEWIVWFVHRTTSCCDQLNL